MTKRRIAEEDSHSSARVLEVCVIKLGLNLFQDRNSLNSLTASRNSDRMEIQSVSQLFVNEIHALDDLVKKQTALFAEAIKLA